MVVNLHESQTRAPKRARGLLQGSISQHAAAAANQVKDETLEAHSIRNVSSFCSYHNKTSLRVASVSCSC